MTRRPRISILALTLTALLVASASAADAKARLQALHQRLLGFRAKMTAKAVCADAALARAELAVEKARLLLRAYQPSSVRNMIVGRELDAVDAFFRNPKQPALAKPKGFHEMAYISDIDLSPQPYLLYVPSCHDGKRRLPLLIFLHGYAGDLNKVNWASYMYSPTLQEVCEKLGFVLVLPYARSNTEFMGVGESDVLHVMGLVKKLVPIDDDRVVLSGASMGGSGAYSIACHYPDLFAGVFTVTGRVDYYVWMKRPREMFPPFKQVQTDADYARYLLGNLLHVPVFIGHGTNDHLLEVKQSRLMAKLLRERKQSVEYVEFPDESHYIWSETFQLPQLQAKLKTWRRPAHPRKVQFKTYTLKYRRAYWVDIGGILTWSRPVEVTAEVKKGNRVELAAKNVTTLTLRPGAELIDPKKPVEVVLNGKARRLRPDAKGAIRVEVAKPVNPRPLRKTPDLCGPVREIYDTPFVFVIPTGKCSELTTALESTRRLATEWIRYAQGRAPMKRDTDVTAADMATHSLILCGDPEANLVTKRIMAKLPVRIEKDVYVVGKRRFPREGNGLMMIYPNPLNPKRYVMIHDGAQWGPSLSSNHKLEFMPDFIVYKAGTDDDGTYFKTNPYVCAGYFDSFWRLIDKSLWVATPEDGKKRP